MSYIGQFSFWLAVAVVSVVINFVWMKFVSGKKLI